MFKYEKKNSINDFLTKFTALTIVFSIGVVMLGTLISFESGKSVVTSRVTDDRIIVIFDPGHGGEDGGAVAFDGTAEKDLNLDFAKCADSLCGLLGIDSVLTRNSDELLYDKYDDLEDYTGKKKVFDLKNRLKFTESYGDKTIFVGIHMNKFSDARYSGTQIYYSPNSESSRVFAESMQNKIRDTLQPENERKIKRAGSSIFLLNRLRTTAILAECGFLSNEAETSRLKSTEYKKEFSLTTAVVLGEFINSMD